MRIWSARLSIITIAVAAIAGLTGSVSQAQEPVAPPFAVVGETFYDSAGDAGTLFPEGEDIDVVLQLQATGEAAVTGITATMTFERGTVVDGSGTWSDLSGVPSPVYTNDDDRFTFRWGERLQVDDPGDGPVDASTGCFVATDAYDGSEDAIVDDPEANQVVETDPEEDPSDPFEPIPPGGLRFTIESDQGSLEYVIPLAFVCSGAGVSGPFLPGGTGAGTEGGTATLPGSLANTGATTTGIGFSGGALLLAGFVMRSRGRRRVAA